MSRTVSVSVFTLMLTVCVFAPYACDLRAIDAAPGPPSISTARPLVRKRPTVPETETELEPVVSSPSPPPVSDLRELSVARSELVYTMKDIIRSEPYTA